MCLLCNKGVNYDRMFNAWMSVALKKSKKSVTYAQVAHIKCFESLIKTICKIFHKE